MTEQRTFKFRAWSFTDKKFYDRVCVGDTSTDDPCSIVWVSDERGWVNFDKLNGVFQQFTGLKDSKGVEIYEGDIVKGLFLDTDVHHWAEATAPVVWVDRVGGFNISSDTWDRLSIEVVGNIFENGDKLEKTTNL